MSVHAEKLSHVVFDSSMLFIFRPISALYSLCEHMAGRDFVDLTANARG